MHYNTDILCVDETQMRSAGRANFVKKHTLLYSGSNNSSHHSVEIILKNELLSWYR